jgi:ADP-ribose pyrophosphatase
MSDSHWRLEGSKYLLQSPWYALRQDRLRLPNGRQITYNVVEHPGYVLIVPLLCDGRVVMERIYRYTLGRTCLECPSGGLDGQSPRVAALRELEEETGYIAEHLQPLGRFAGSSGMSNIEFDIFLATKLRQGTIKREETEEIELELVGLEDLHRMASEGIVDTAPSALAIMLAYQAITG